tara:strand:- start:263 stop:1084 length:822 start_codon:yes stop_codon:yes gene_type:complete
MGAVLAGSSMFGLAQTKLFGDEISASSDAKDMSVAVEALFRPEGDGNRLIAALGGLDTNDSSVFVRCVEDQIDPAVALVCTLRRQMHATVRVHDTLPELKTTLSTKDAIVLEKPALPTPLNVANFPNCTVSVGDFTVIDEACADFTPIAEYCLHVGLGASTEFLWRPIPDALHDAIVANPEKARVVFSSHLADGRYIQVVNGLSSTHPPLSFEEAYATIGNAELGLGKEACTAFANLIASTDPITCAIQAALDGIPVPADCVVEPEPPTPVGC